MAADRSAPAPLGSARPGPDGARPGEQAADPPAELLIALPAVSTSTRRIRQRLRAWLTGWGWVEDALDDIVMAVDEAVSNVVEHAYRLAPAPGDVRVHARIAGDPGGRRAVVAVTDHGRWRPVPSDPGHRGRGLRMMDAFMASLRIERDDDGTEVTMTSTVLPAVAAD
jgi:anti-sigma regulatory factor (Ser/Thr protein kinase)